MRSTRNHINWNPSCCPTYPSLRTSAKWYQDTKKIPLADGTETEFTSHQIRPDKNVHFDRTTFTKTGDGRFGSEPLNCIRAEDGKYTHSHFESFPENGNPIFLDYEDQLDIVPEARSNGHLVKQEVHPSQAKTRRIQWLLKHLELHRIDITCKKMTDILSSVEVLDALIFEIFEHLSQDPSYTYLYAVFCSRLYHTLEEGLHDARTINGKKFCSALLQRCKDQFEQFANSTSDNCSDEPFPGSISNEKDKVEDEDKLWSSTGWTPEEMLTNVDFIGELYLEGLVKEVTIHKKCIQKLLNAAMESASEDQIEALCRLLNKIGPKLIENPGAAEHMVVYFDCLRSFSDEQPLSYHTHTMIQKITGTEGTEEHTFH